MESNIEIPLDVEKISKLKMEMLITVDGQRWRYRVEVEDGRLIGKPLVKTKPGRHGYARPIRWQEADLGGMDEFYMAPSAGAGSA